MRLAGAQWRIDSADVAVDGRWFRVVRPVRPPRHAVLYDGYRDGQMFVDKSAALELAAAWWLAARSPRTVVWLPLRQTVATCGSEVYGDRFDLVLMHHSLGLPPSDWKVARSRVRQVRPQTVTLPERPFRPIDDVEHERAGHDGFRDHLRFETSAQTMFLIGSRLAFDLRAEQLRALVEDCPAHMATRPETHCCAEIGIGSGVGWNRGGLHIEYCNDHR